MRTATQEDIGPVLDFWQVAAENAHRPPDSAAALARLLQRDPDALILAEEDGQLVGTAIAGWDGWRCHLYRLAVAPGRRREGIGSALLRCAEERFAVLGGGRADAVVLRENELAQQVWGANGYGRQPEWERWVKPLEALGWWLARRYGGRRADGGQLPRVVCVAVASRSETGPEVRTRRPRHAGGAHQSPGAGALAGRRPALDLIGRNSAAQQTSRFVRSRLMLDTPVSDGIALTVR
jgi:ribosomal protein S18 acetylase RimI-like enzyme